MAYYASLPPPSSSSNSFASSSSSSSAPVTRSRTGLFLSYRDTAIRSTSSSNNSFSFNNSKSCRAKGKGRAYDDVGADGNEESQGLLLNGESSNAKTGNGHTAHEVVQMNTLPPQWVDEADKVDEILQRFKTKFAQLDKLHSKHVLPGFSDKTHEEREIANLTSDITRDLRKCQTIISRIAYTAKNLPLSTTVKEDRVMIQNVQTALATKVQNASTVFRKKQSNYLKQLRGYELRNQDILAASGAIPIKDSYDSMHDDVELSKDTLATSSFQQQDQLLAEPSGGASMSLEAVTSRSREITSIAESITDLAELFKDLSGMVIDQGTLLDRVDWNIENMANDMQGAVEELKTAKTYQRRSGKRQIICLLILLIIAAIIIIVYKPRNSSRPPVRIPEDPQTVPQGGVDVFSWQQWP